jgi:Phage capsid family
MRTQLQPLDDFRRRFRDAHTRRALDELRHQVAAQIRQVADEMDDAGAGDGSTDPELSALFAALRAILDDIDQKISRQAVIDDLDTRMQRGGARDRAGQRWDAGLAEFSLRGMIASAIGSPIAGLDLGRSLEISQELRMRAGGRSFVGFPAPIEALHLRASYARKLERRADTISTDLPAAGPGGSLIPLVLDGSRYIDALRARTVVLGAGAQMISDLVGDLDIPRLKATGQVGWFREGEEIMETDQQFDRVSFRPKHCGSISSYSRNMLLQAQSPEIEMVIRDDLSRLLALELDRVALCGSGVGPEPLGIVRNPAVRRLPSVTFGYLDNVELRAMLSGSNVPLESLGFIGNSQIDAWSLSALDAVSRPLGKGIVYLGLPDYTSNVCTAAAIAAPPAPAIDNPLILGAFGDLYLAAWSALDILPNALADSAYRRAAVLVRALMTVDVGVRHPESFAWQEVQNGPALPPLIGLPAAPPANGAAQHPAQAQPPRRPAPRAE